MVTDSGKKGSAAEGSAAARDIKTDLAKAIDSEKFPSLSTFLKTLPREFAIIAHPGVIDWAKAAAGDNVADHWLHFVDASIRSLDQRYSNLADMKDEELASKDQEIANLTERYNQQAQQLTELASQVASLATHQNTPVARATNVPHPKAFSGDEKDSAKRTQAFETFELGVITRWDSYPTDFPTERSKISYINTLLEGSAAAGVHNGIKNIFANPADPTQWAWKTGMELLKHLASKYATLDMAADAERKLKLLAQEGDFARFTDFLTEYINLTDIAAWDSASCVRGLESRVSKKLQEAMALQLDTPDRDDFQGWVKMAQTLATKQEALEHLKKRGNSNGNNGGNGTGKTDKPADKGDPMDLDAMKLAVNRLSDTERNRRYNEGLCYHCARPGHVMKDCYNKVNRGGRGGGSRSRGGAPRGGMEGRGNYNYGQWADGGGRSGWQQPYNNNGNAGFGINRRGRGGYGNGRSSGYSNGGPQLRFANTSEYVPYTPEPQGYVIGEVGSDYDTGYNNNDVDSQSQKQGNT